MWLKILRQNLSQLARRAKGSASIEQKNGNGNNKGNKTNNNGAEVNRNEEQNGSLDKSQAKKKPVVPGGTPLLQQTEISTSQLDFFRMLDEKIENGPDYDETAEASLRAEHVSGLLRSWELASVSWSNVADDNSNAFDLMHQQYHYPPQQQQQVQPQSHRTLGPQYPRPGHSPLPPPLSGTGASLSAKDREGMRNIVGGRPETAPVYVQRISSANRVDGLQDVVGHHHQYRASPSMPRHVLESISQSPTQSLKTPPGVSSPTSVSRYQHYHHPELQPVAKPGQSQYSQVPAPLNGEYAQFGDRDYHQRQQQQQQQLHQLQQYEGPMLRNSPSNPYVQQFQIASSPAQQFAAPRKRGGFNAAQMT